MASPELQQLLAMLRAIPRRENPTVERLRRGFEAMTRVFPVAADVGVEVTALGGVPVERVAPPGVDPGRAIFYVHGGGFVMGSPGTHRNLVARLCRAAGAVGWVPDYRLAPEHPFPRGIDDVVAAYRAVLATGLSPARVAIVGDSAGGGLTMATLLALRNARLPLPAAAVCISPWVDLTISGASVETRAELDPWIPAAGLHGMKGLYLAGADARHPLASPIFADLSGLPPLLVQVGTAEILHDDAERLAAQVRACGGEVTFEAWEEMVHVWHAFPMLPEAGRAVERIATFVRERT
jgi:acetyl esterase/lipase